MAIALPKTSPRRGAGHKLIQGTLSIPLLQFDLGSEVDQLQRDESWRQTTGRSSKTLVKHPDLRIVVIGMKANSRMHEHTAAARISIHALRGHIRLHLPQHVVDLPAGHLVALDRSVPHDVEALEDSALLLTLSWPPQAKARKSKSRSARKGRHGNK